MTQPTVPAGRYADEYEITRRIRELRSGAPLDLDTLGEIATTIETLQSRISALENTHFLILE